MIAGIGRTWVDEILHAAKLSPFKRGDDLSEREAKALRKAMVGELQRVLDVYEEKVAAPAAGEVPEADARARPPGRAVPALRDGARGRLLRGLRDDATARTARPRAGSSRTAGSPGCSSRRMPV